MCESVKCLAINHIIPVNLDARAQRVGARASALVYSGLAMPLSCCVVHANNTVNYKSYVGVNYKSYGGEKFRGSLDFIIM